MTIFRRDAVALLLGACARAAGDLAPGAAALLVDIPTRRLLTVHDEASASRIVVPPGSTVKPIVLAALLRSGKLKPGETFPCPGDMRIDGRSFACSHPRLDTPVGIREALAYSCNCFVARVAERLEPGELAREFERYGLTSRSGLLRDEAAGRVQPAATSGARRTQALGEFGIAITTAELVLAYRMLATTPDMQPIVAGLEDAVRFGTAQRAQVPGLRVAGKTGSVRIASGARIAWFAGFAPSVEPKVAVAVMLQGRSGGADAAPVAARILEAWQAGR